MNRHALLILLSLVVSPSLAGAGHTRPPYVDGCQSMGGRFVVTAAYDKDRKQWQYTWKDTREGKELSGWLQGLPDGQGHFTVAYAHIFVPPDGETFAVWNPCSWSGNTRELGKVPARDSKDFRSYRGFADRLIIYRKTGEILKRLSIQDFYHDGDWDNVHWVQGNLYWLAESPDWLSARSSGEPPRVGYRYYRVSPDYTRLEVTIGPDAEIRAKSSTLGKKMEPTRRTVLVDLTTGTLLAEKSSDVRKLPVRAFQGPMVRRGDEMKNYVPSLDPVRVPGSVSSTGLSADKK